MGINSHIQMLEVHHKFQAITQSEDQVTFYELSDHFVLFFLFESGVPKWHNIMETYYEQLPKVSKINFH